MSNALEDQRRRSIRFRALVAVTLRSLGFPAESRAAVRRLSAETLTTDPDVVGIDGVHMVASPIGWSRVSTYLNKAVLAADERGHGDVPVLCLPRQEREPAESYCVLRLCDFAELAQDAARGRSQAPQADLTRSDG